MKRALEFKVNGEEVSLDVAPHERLVDVLRDRLHLTGAKVGCGNGECGACTIIMNGQALRSCLILAVEAQGGEITTIEGLGRGEALDPVQQAFIDLAAVQCGFCTPGFILAVRALLDENPDPTPDEAREALSGHLCRCTGYEAVLAALDRAVALNRASQEP